MLLIQGLCVLILVLACLLVQGPLAAVAALLGGITYIVPHALFALCLFHRQGARAAQAIAQGFYLGEALKWLTAVILMALIFKQWPLLSPLSFLLGFASVALFTPLLALWRPGGLAS